MDERDEDLARSGARQANVILHHRIAADVAVFDPRRFETPRRLMRCLGGAVLSASRIASMTKTSGPSFGSRARRRVSSLGSHIAGRRRIAAHFGNRVRAQPNDPRCPAPTLPFDENKPSNRRANLHREHRRPPLFESDFEKVRPRKWPGFTPPRSRKMPPLHGLLLPRRVQRADDNGAPRRDKNSRPDLTVCNACNV